MHIRLNGKDIEFESPILLTELLEKYHINRSTGRIAIAFNERIAFREEWDLLMLNDGDRIEIIHAVQGG